MAICLMGAATESTESSSNGPVEGEVQLAWHGAFEAQERTREGMQVIHE